MNSVLVFMGRSAVDGNDFRWQLLRVPEVSQVLKEAQLIVDECMTGAKDLVSFIQSDNSEYLAGGLWREFCAQLMQVGLYRRYEKNYERPRFIVGDAGPLSAAPACLGLSSLQDLVMVFVEEMAKKAEAAQSQDFLVGQKLETSKVYEIRDGQFTVLADGKATAALLELIAKDYLLDHVITLGSTAALEGAELLTDLGVVESVVMDPLLSWMLPYLKTA